MRPTHPEPAVDRSPELAPDPICSLSVLPRLLRFGRPHILGCAPNVQCSNAFLKSDSINARKKNPIENKLLAKRVHAAVAGIRKKCIFEGGKEKNKKRKEKSDFLYAVNILACARFFIVLSSPCVVSSPSAGPTFCTRSRGLGLPRSAAADLLLTPGCFAATCRLRSRLRRRLGSRGGRRQPEGSKSGKEGDI